MSWGESWHENTDWLVREKRHYHCDTFGQPQSPHRNYFPNSPDSFSSLSFCCLQSLLKVNLTSCCDKQPHTTKQEQHSFNILHCSFVCCIEDDTTGVSWTVAMTTSYIERVLYLQWKTKCLVPKASWAELNQYHVVAVTKLYNDLKTWSLSAS